MVEFVVVAALTALEVDDEFARTEWPPHVTVLPNARFDDPMAVLVRSMSAIASAVPRMDLALASSELFGPARDIAVLVVRPDERLTALHLGLLGMTSRLGAKPVVAEHNAIGYRAHVTMTPDLPLSVGDEITLRSLTLVELAGSRTRVIWTVAIPPDF